MTIDTTVIHWANGSADEADTFGAYGAWMANRAIAPPRIMFNLVKVEHAPAVASAFYREKLACYSRFKAAAASVPLADCLGGKHIHLVVATDEQSGEMVGGVSIYRRAPGAPLPIERAIGHIPEMKREAECWTNRHVVELSGLWASESWRKTGISEQLMLVAFAATHVLGAEIAIGFSHQHVLAFYGTVGLLPDQRLGNFNYPNPDYVSTVVRGDPIELTTLPLAKRSAVRKIARHLTAGRSPTWDCAGSHPSSKDGCVTHLSVPR